MLWCKCLCLPPCRRVGGAAVSPIRAVLDLGSIGGFVLQSLQCNTFCWRFNRSISGLVPSPVLSPLRRIVCALTS